MNYSKIMQFNRVINSLKIKMLKADNDTRLNHLIKLGNSTYDYRFINDSQFNNKVILTLDIFKKNKHLIKVEGMNSNYAKYI